MLAISISFLIENKLPQSWDFSITEDIQVYVERLLDQSVNKMMKAHHESLN